MDTHTPRVLTLAMALASLASCPEWGHGTEARSDHAETGSGATSTGSDRGASPSACPARFGEDAPSCGAGDDPGICTYPEGTCRCAVEVFCGGATPPPMPPRWQCEHPRPPCPEPGTPCSADAAPCQIDACGFDHVVCANGVWTAERGPYPP